MRLDNSLNGILLANAILIFIMYGFVCRVIAREVLKDVRTMRVFGVCWAIGVLVFGTFMQLTTPDDPWIGAAIFVSPMAAGMGLAAAGR